MKSGDKGMRSRLGKAAAIDDGWALDGDDPEVFAAGTDPFERPSAELAPFSLPVQATQPESAQASGELRASSSRPRFIPLLWQSELRADASVVIEDQAIARAIDSGRPPPAEVAVTASGVLEVADDFSTLDRAFFDDGESLAAQPAPAGDDFSDLAESSSLWKRFWRRS